MLYQFNNMSQIFEKKDILNASYDMELHFRLYKTNAQDWKSLNWGTIAKMYNGLTGPCLYYHFKELVHRKVPKDVQHDLRGKIYQYANQLICRIILNIFLKLILLQNQLLF